MGNLPSNIYAGLLVLLYNLSEKYNELISKDNSDNSKKENLLDDNSNFKDVDIENQNISNSRKTKENQTLFRYVLLTSHSFSNQYLYIYITSLLLSGSESRYVYSCL